MARTMLPPQSTVIALARRIGRPDADLLERWAERAAMREYVGGSTRADAEASAVDDIRSIYTNRTEII